MEENEQLEEEGNKVTSGEDGEEMLRGPEDGGADAELPHMPSKGTPSPADDPNSNLDSTNLDSEPGVLDQDH